MTAYSKRPVLFFIHGGVFQEGQCDDQLYCTDLITWIKKGEVIVVRPTYRVGIFGFLNLEDGDINGNMGLKDQRAALTWIYNNIEAFGGDKSRITVMGQSAGKWKKITY